MLHPSPIKPKPVTGTYVLCFDLPQLSFCRKNEYLGKFFCYSHNHPPVLSYDQLCPAVAAAMSLRGDDGGTTGLSQGLKIRGGGARSTVVGIICPSG